LGTTQELVVGHPGPVNTTSALKLLKPAAADGKGELLPRKCACRGLTTARHWGVQEGRGNLTRARFAAATSAPFLSSGGW
jgi:hypothetical protein